MAKVPEASNESWMRVPYQKVRDLTTKDEESNGASTHVVVMTASDFSELSFAVEASEAEESKTVRAAITRTIMEYPDRFTQLHSGILISASKISVTDDKKTALLKDARLTDGAVTFDVIRKYFAEREARAKAKMSPRDILEGRVKTEAHSRDFSVRCTIVVDANEGLHGWARLTHNTRSQTDVLSRLTEQPAFIEFARDLAAKSPTFGLSGKSRASESDIDALVLLQVLAAMMPSSFSLLTHRSKTFALYQPAESLRLLTAAYEKRGSDKKATAEYRYFSDMAEAAWTEYVKWKDRGYWVAQAGGGNLESLPEFIGDTAVFPILAALSAFVAEKDGRWVIVPPKLFKDDDIVLACRRQSGFFSRTPASSPDGAYEALSLVTEMAKRYSAEASLKK